MKKSILIFILTALCLAVCLASVSCNSEKGDGETSPESTPTVSEPVETPESDAGEESGDGDEGDESEESEESESVIESHLPVYGHHWEKNEELHWHGCTICGFEKTDVAEHEWNVVVVNKEPSADEPGEGVLVCKICGAAKNGEIPPLGSEE